MKNLPNRPVTTTGLLAVVAALIATFVSLSGDASASEVPVPVATASTSFTPATSPSIAPASLTANRTVPAAVDGTSPLKPDPPPPPAATVAKPATTTKKPATTSKKVVAPAPKPVVKPPVANNPGAFGTNDPAKIGQYCITLNGHYTGYLCPKPDGSPL